MILRCTPTPLSLALAVLFSAPAFADDEAPAGPLNTVVVEGSRASQLGVAGSASAGVVTQKQLEARTVYRPGELLEVTPGLIVSQHSGEGKANQFYLRGINLDHGTDLRSTVDGMLVNQRTHAHGQGWTDVNFMIPELASYLEYAKGPYSAEQGDFASAGAVTVNYANTLAQGIASVGIGENGYARTLLADSPALGNGNLLYALELFKNDGPFVNKDQYRKLNGVLRYSEGTEANGFNVSLMAYKAHWNATDQIPQRAFDSGLLQSRFDAIDTTDGGEAHRVSLSGAWIRTGDDSSTKVNAYVIQNQLDLYSNFTYFLDHPDTGDQFSQPDRRLTLGVNASHAWRQNLFNRASETVVGLQLQSDDIHNGLYDTQARRRTATTREDHVRERSAGLYVQNAIKWTPWFRTVLGAREDYFHNDVASALPVNSGTATGRQFSPKAALIFGPWDRTEFYVNLGRGFHSNDARGTTIRVDPKNPDTAATRERPLVASKGLELGARSELVRGLQTSLALFQLDYDSELLFAGDAGSTADTGRPSRRRGVELSNYYKLASWLTVDADLAYARTRYRDADLAGQFIPGSIEGVGSLAVTVDNVGPWFGALQLRYFGPRPLIEDDSVRSKATGTLNGRIGYKFSPKLRLSVEVYNLTDRRDSAIDYYYQSRLQGEGAEGAMDVHFHPIESRSVRVNLVANF
ncbi:MAG TPA: TonB-dependent receptor [Telluria sp.]|jgi:outer membrane receptor protein involved in Fe transport